MSLEHNFKINASADKVYDAVATDHGIKGWWCKDSEVAESENGPITLNFVKDGNPVAMKFKVDELSPNKKVKWTCTDNGNPAWVGTTLEFDIKEGNGETEFHFDHAHWDAQWEGTPPKTNTSEGWDYFMNSLKDYCEKGSGGPW